MNDRARPIVEDKNCVLVGGRSWVVGVVDDVVGVGVGAGFVSVVGGAVGG